jgi:transcription elongation GreA/GreB family factor
MESKFNRRGAWRKMELMENKAVKEGKQVKVTRKLVYSDDSTRPTKIISEIEIDGEKTILSLENPLPA